MSDRDRTTWELGWDFAHFGWTIPDQADEEFCRGYKAFKHGGRRPQKKNPTIYEKKWLQLRMSAWRRGKDFDADVTPDFLHSLMPLDECCPVTKDRLTFASKADTDWSIERGNNEEGYIQDNLIVISVRANKAKSNFSFERICEFADGRLVNDSLTNEEWCRLEELVEPMQQEPGFRGVIYMEGQKVAEGVAMTPLAHFQNIMARMAIDEQGPYDPMGFAMVFKSLCDSICSTKKEVRAFRRLLIAVRQRAKCMKYPDRLWGTPKVHRRLHELLKSLGPEPGRYMERLAHGLQEAQLLRFVQETLGEEALSELVGGGGLYSRFH